MLKKLLLTSVLSLGLVATTNGAYTSVDCSTNKTFGEYSCNQCFDGGIVKEGDILSFLDDVWHNDGQNKKIMYKEEQKMPTLTPLNGASFAKKPDNDTFWEYTKEFDALKDAEFDGYVLPAGKSVSWLKSSMGAGYKVEKLGNESSAAGILVFDVMSHDILNTGEIEMNNKAHKECVLYKAGAGKVATPIVEETPAPTKEPAPKAEEMTKVKTGPEMYFLVMIISFLLGLAIMNRKVILERVKK